MSRLIRVREFREESLIWNDRMFFRIGDFLSWRKKYELGMYLGRFDCSKNVNNSKIYKISY